MSLVSRIPGTAAARYPHAQQQVSVLCRLIPKNVQKNKGEFWPNKEKKAWQVEHQTKKHFFNAYPIAVAFSLCSCTAASNSKSNGHWLVHTDSNKANQNEAWIYLAKGFTSIKLNHLKDENSGNCFLHVAWRVSQEKAAVFKLHLSATHTAAERCRTTSALTTPLLGLQHRFLSAKLTAYRVTVQQPTWEKGSFSLTTCHCITLPVLEMSFALDMSQPSETHPAPVFCLSGWRSNECQKGVSKERSVRQSASHSCHLSICESGGIEEEWDLTQTWLRSVWRSQADTLSN